MTTRTTTTLKKNTMIVIVAAAMTTKLTKSVVATKASEEAAAATIDTAESAIRQQETTTNRKRPHHPRGRTLPPSFAKTVRVTRTPRSQRSSSKQIATTMTTTLRLQKNETQRTKTHIAVVRLAQWTSRSIDKKKAATTTMQKRVTELRRRQQQRLRRQQSMAAANFSRANGEQTGRSASRSPNACFRRKRNTPVLLIIRLLREPQRSYPVQLLSIASGHQEIFL